MSTADEQAALLEGFRLAHRWLLVLDQVQTGTVTPAEFEELIRSEGAGSPLAMGWLALYACQQAADVLGVGRREVIDNVAARIEQDNTP